MTVNKQRVRSKFRTNGWQAGRGVSLIVSRGDNLLLLSALLLTAVGLVMVYSSSTFVAAKHDKLDWYFFSRQLLFTVIGLVALIVGARLDVSFYRRWVKAILIGFSIVMEA